MGKEYRKEFFINLAFWSFFIAFFGGFIGFYFIPVSYEWGKVVVTELLVVSILSVVAADLDKIERFIKDFMSGKKKEIKPAVAA